MILRRLNFSILMGIVLASSACVSNESVPLEGEAVAGMKEETVMESINNAVYDNESVRFTVISNGCTSVSDFIVEHVINNGRCELTVVRTRPDFCRKASAPFDVELGWAPPATCSALDIVFLNPEIGDIRPTPRLSIKTPLTPE